MRKNPQIFAKRVILSIVLFVCSNSLSAADEAQEQARADKEAIAIFRRIHPAPGQVPTTDEAEHHCIVRNYWSQSPIPGELARKYLGTNVRADLVSPSSATWPENLLKTIFDKDDGCQVGQTNSPDNKTPPEPDGAQKLFYTVLEFSYPIFNSRYNRALVIDKNIYANYFWKGNAWDRRTAGGGNILVFEKKNGRWSQIASEEEGVE